MAIAYPTIVYGQGSSIETQPRLIMSDFGDGYQQVIADGINYLPRTGTLEHPLLNNTKAAEILAFLRANSAGQVVTIINYMEDPTGATTLNVRINNWSHTQTGITQNYYVNFREAFST
jgi:phage-related protein